MRARVCFAGIHFVFAASAVIESSEGAAADGEKRGVF